MLQLDMAGARLDRLNNGAPVFDNHMSGTDVRSVMANKAGTRAQIGVVQKAWADGPKGMATLKFRPEGQDATSDLVWSGIQSGIIRSLSFGTWLYAKEPQDASNGATSNVFTATDWEPFEISAVNVPADFTTTFLSAASADHTRATRPTRETIVMETTTQAGGDARNDQVVLDAARAEGTRLERQRVSEITLLGVSFKLEKLAASLVSGGVSIEEAKLRFAGASEIRTIGAPMLKYGVPQQFIDGLIDEGLTLDAARAKIQDELAARANQTRDGREFQPRSEVVITRDANETRLACMQEALVLRCNPQFYMQKRRSFAGEMEFLPGGGAEIQRRAEEMGREYVGFSLLEMARESLELRGVNTRGMDKMTIATKALIQYDGKVEIFGGGAESTSDFPSILANVANKTLRQSYEAYPQTFKPFSRQVTAPDFKPINRVQLSDSPALRPLNEKGEYTRLTLTDTNQNYSLATYGGVVALTRKTIINDDLQAFTRIPAVLGVAAARKQSDVVWAIITGNQVMQVDNTAMFATAHNNLLTGANSALALGAGNPVTGIAAGRVEMRTQTGPQGTPLNLIPRYPTDTVDTLAQRFVNAINTLFVGISAAKTGTGQLTMTTLSPVAGFTLFTSYAAGTGANGANPSTGSITASGDIKAGNEGVWQVDASQSQPLNRAFVDYLTDFCAQVQAAGQTMTVSFSQELLAPPDVNTAAGAWAQRFANGNQVLTDTGFGSWGAGFVEAVTGSSPITIQQTGHGYITGNTVHISSSTQSGVWAITVTNGNHYQFTTLISGGYTPSVGDATFVDLQTTQCTFNPSTVTPYLAACYTQAAGIMSTAGLTPWLQFGEFLWWFFSVVQNLAVGYASWTSPISIGTVTAHGLSTGQRAILAGIQGNTAANGDQAITVSGERATRVSAVSSRGTDGSAAEAETAGASRGGVASGAIEPGMGAGFRIGCSGDRSRHPCFNGGGRLPSWPSSATRIPSSTWMPGESA
jgi:hypothetical protein